MRTFLYIIIWLIAFSERASAQFLFDNLKPSDGLSAREVKCLFRDREGFMWMGTTNGINRYDGSHFRIWNHKDPAYPKDLGQVINALIDGNDGSVWVGTDAGAAIFDKNSFRFRQVAFKKPFVDSKLPGIVRFQRDRQGVLWVATTKGIFISKNESLLPVSNIFPFAAVADSAICYYSSFLFDSSRNMIWAGTDNGLLTIDLDNRLVYSDKHNPKGYPFYNKGIISALAFDREGNLWWGDGKDASLNYFDFSSSRTEKIFHINGNPMWNLGGGPNNLYIDQSGRLWISTWLFTMFTRTADGVFEPVEYSQNQPHSIGYGFFTDAFEDKYGNLWFATINGVSRYTPHRFVKRIIKAPSYDFYLPTGFANINTLTPGVKGTWWLGKMEGLVRYDTAEGKFRLYKPHSKNLRWNEVFDIDIIAGEVWCATGNGIQIFDPSKSKFRTFSYPTKENEKTERSISWIHQDSHGFIWFSVWGTAVYRYDPKNAQFTIFDGSESSYGDMDTRNSVSIFEAGQKLWINSWDKGIRIFDLGTNRFSMPPDKSLRSDVTYSMVGDHKGNIWVSSGRNSILKCTGDGKVVDSITKRHGLTGNNFFDLVFDGSNRLWAISREGMLCILPEAKQVIPVKIDVTFSFNDHWNSLIKSGDQLYATMLDNIVILDAAKFQQLPAQVPPMISGFKVFQQDQPFSKDEKIRLGARQNFFSIDFSSPFHRDHSSIQYAYKLEGFDQDWVNCGRKQTAEYTNVPDGNYTFMVRSTDGSDKWMEASTSMVISIAAPFWKSWWFILGMLVLVAMAAAAFWRSRKQLHARKRIERTIDYFANSVYGDNSVSEICWDIARNCISQLQFEDCVVYLVDRDRKVLVQKAAYGPKNPKGHEIENPLEIPIGKGIVGTVAATGKPELVGDTSKDSRYIVDDELRFSEIAVPIMHDNEVIGVIDSEHPEKHFFTVDHLKAMTTIASISANKIAEAQAEAYARENEIKLLEINKLLAESQLMALRAQMNPHFVFNCLNSIQECIVTRKYGEASDYLNKFSKLFRMVLNNSGKQLVTLEEEIEVLRLYLDLELMRFDKSFEYHIDLDKQLEAEEILVPSMLLQPYVENALWHGLMHKEGNRKLQLSFKKTGEDVFSCTIDDNGIGRKRSFELKEQQSKSRRHESKGLAISADRVRLLQKQGYHAKLDIRDKYDSTGAAAGTLVEIELSTFLGN